MQAKCEKLEREQKIDLIDKKRMQEDIAKNAKTHEEEVSLRLRFEEKLNSLHALNRITGFNYTQTFQSLKLSEQ